MQMGCTCTRAIFDQLPNSQGSEEEVWRLIEDIKQIKPLRRMQKLADRVFS